MCLYTYEQWCYGHSRAVWQLTDFVRAVVVVVAFALIALQARPDLGTNANAISYLDVLHLRANFYDLADDLMAHADGCGRISPAAGNGVNVRSTNTATFDLDINVVVAKPIGLELKIMLMVSIDFYLISGMRGFREKTYALLLEFRVLPNFIDHETFELVRVRHLVKYKYVRKLLRRIFENYSKLYSELRQILLM